MAFEEKLQTVSLVATSDVRQYGVVSLDSNGQVVETPLAGTSASIIGVAQHAAATGEAVTVAFAGVTKVVAGGTVTAGAEVAVGTVNASVIDRGAATTKRVIGLALDGTTVSGKWVAVLLNIGRAVAAT
jgi:hypothetical protein